MTLVRYEHPKIAFALSLPSKWRATSATPRSLFFGKENRVLAVTATPWRDSFDALVETAMRELAPTFEDANVADHRPLAGEPQTATLTFRHEQTPQMMLVSLHDGLAYRVSHDGSIDEVRDTFDAIRRTFEFGAEPVSDVHYSGPMAERRARIDRMLEWFNIHRPRKR